MAEAKCDLHIRHYYYLAWPKLLSARPLLSASKGAAPTVAFVRGVQTQTTPTTLKEHHR